MQLFEFNKQADTSVEKSHEDSKEENYPNVSNAIMHARVIQGHAVAKNQLFPVNF